MNKHIRDLYYGVLVLSLLVCIGVSSGETPSISDQNTRTVIGADFVADHQQGKAPHTVTFHDLSTGRPEQYAWDFGDGDVSSEANPVHTYATPGVYTVSLTVSGSAGFDKKTRIGYITVIEEPSVDTSSEPKSEESRLPNDSAILVQNGEMVRSEEVLFLR
jgi:PKD repeat protein